MFCVELGTLLENFASKTGIIVAKAIISIFKYFKKKVDRTKFNAIKR